MVQDRFPGSDGSLRGESLTCPALLVPAAAALRQGQVTTAEHVRGVCRRVELVDAEVHALLPEPGRLDRLLREATAQEARWPSAAERPPLFGIVVGVKDLFRVDGFPTQAGSALPPALFDGPEAPAVTALRAAGALVLGKTAMDEFAYCEPAPTRNPHNLAHTPGGSSSGSAAAVAAGLCPLALGTQTSRSVIGPAAFCGIVGFKPSFGRIPTEGVVPLAPSLDTVGLFTQDVEGMVFAASVLVPDWREIGDAHRPVLGVPEGKFLTWTLEEGRRGFADHVRRLEQAGYEIRRVRFFEAQDLEEMDRWGSALLHGEMARVHAEWFQNYGHLYRPRTANGVRRGQQVGEEELATSRSYGLAFRARIETLMRDASIDVWVCPASAGSAPAGLERTGWGGMTLAWSYAGLPCITVPAGRGDTGLPLGLQCVAPFGQDELLLSWARAIVAVFATRH